MNLNPPLFFFFLYFLHRKESGGGGVVTRRSMSQISHNKYKKRLGTAHHEVLLTRGVGWES